MNTHNSRNETPSIILEYLQHKRMETFKDLLLQTKK